MGNIDSILQNAVNQITEPKKEVVPEVQEEKVAKKVAKKPPIEEIKEEPKEEEQLDLLPEETKIEKKKFKVKAYGKEKELEVDDKELPNYIQKGYAAEEKWKEAQEALRKAAEIEKRNQEFAQSLKKDPENAMELILGRETLDSLSEKRILRAMEMEKMTPEQREEYEVKQRLAKYKKELEEVDQKAQKIEEERKINEFQTSFKALTMNALKKVGFEAPSRMVINRFLMTVRPFLENADGPATEEDMDILAQHFSQTLSEEQNEHISNMDGPTLVKWLGSSNVEKIRKELSQGMKPAATKPVQPVKKEEKPAGNLRDYIKSL